MAAGWGSVQFGAAVPVGVRVGVHRLSVRFASSGRCFAWRSAAVAGWAAGSDEPLQGVTLGGSSGWVSPWAALPASGSSVLGSAGAGASSACGLGAAQGVSPLRVRWGRCLPGGHARPVVWRAGFPRWCGCCRCLCVDACGVARGCVCAGSEPCPSPLSQLPELRVGPALPPPPMGGAVALGGDFGVGVCGEIMGNGGGGELGRVLVVLCRGGARGAGCGRTRTRGYVPTVSASGFGWDPWGRP